MLVNSTKQTLGPRRRMVDGLKARARTAALVSIAACAAAVVMTWPLAAGIGHLGRTQNTGDGRFSVWNIAWVAHALSTDPIDLFDANIFYPHRRTLAFSESNIGPGLLAVPVWVATRNPFATHNVVLLLAFATSVAGAWLLARRLTGDPAAAATAAVLFGFCPYVFSHTAHIQLLMSAGIPICLLLFHKLVDAPTPRRGVVLGLGLAAQALSCAYYGISAGLTIGLAVLFLAWSPADVERQAILDRPCRCRGPVDRARAAILRAVPRDPAREWLRAFTAGRLPMVSVPSLVSRFRRACSPLDAPPHRQREPGGAVSRLSFAGARKSRARDGLASRRCRDRLRALLSRSRDPRPLRSDRDRDAVGVAWSARWSVHGPLLDHPCVFFLARAGTDGDCRCPLSRDLLSLWRA